MYKKLVWSAGLLIIIFFVGTIGYWLVGGRQHSLLDALYMTFITVATIGYGEIIDLSQNPGGRIFTIFIAVSGIGVLFYIITNFTALVVEGELTNSFRRRRMEKKAGTLKDHYIVCGTAGVGLHIVKELRSTKRPHLIVDSNKNNMEKILGMFPDEIFIEGDAADNDTLLRVGIATAKGLFASTEDDNENLVICLTAKQLNPSISIVAQCNEQKNSEKMKRAGADAVVCPTYIGGLRMASEMVRPTVVSFLDTMLRDRDDLRIEEISVPVSFVGKSIQTLNLKEHHQILLLSVRTKSGWLYFPSDQYVLEPEDALVFMTTPEARRQLERVFTQ